PSPPAALVAGAPASGPHGRTPPPGGRVSPTPRRTSGRGSLSPDAALDSSAHPWHVASRDSYQPSLSGFHAACLGCPQPGHVRSSARVAAMASTRSTSVHSRGLPPRSTVSGGTPHFCAVRTPSATCCQRGSRSACATKGAPPSAIV